MRSRTKTTLCERRKSRWYLYSVRGRNDEWRSWSMIEALTRVSNTWLYSRPPPPACDKKQVQAQRAGSPIFDVIVEVERGEVCSWTIVRNVDLAVDAILDRRPYQVEKRTCIPQEEPDLLLEVNTPKGKACFASLKVATYVVGSGYVCTRVLLSSLCLVFETCSFNGGIWPRRTGRRFGRCLLPTNGHRQMEACLARVLSASLGVQSLPGSVQPILPCSSHTTCIIGWK